MAKDRREVARGSRAVRAWIRIDDGFSVRPCQVVDLSHKGVRIKVDAPSDVADLFRLLLTRNEAPGKRCRVKWRKDGEIGAEFVDSGR